MLVLSVIIAFLLLGALWFAAFLNEHDIHPMRKMAEWMRRCSVLEVALVALVAVGLIHHGATKGTNGVNGAGGEMGGTNGVQNVGGFLTGLTGLTGFGNGGGQGLPALPTTNYQLSTTNLDWLAFGGYVDWFRVDDGAWCFRFGSNLVERLTVFSCGEISSAPFGASNRISLLGIPLSIVPAANWHLIAGNEEQGTGNYQLPTTNYQLKSLFWHTATPSNTLLLTWENALVRRDTNLPVTVQAELFPDGAAAFRYDFSGIGDISALSNAETQIWRDGVLASNYQLPTTNYQLSTTNYQLTSFFDAPPITGTNMIGEVYTRIAGGNTNAYYCADVVVVKGPAKIRVEPMADETNRGLLGAYEIVAMPGETNRLPLLIGPKYTVSAETAFESFELVPPPFVPLADDTGTVERLSFGDALTQTNITDRLVEIQWPVGFALEEIDATPEATTYALRITPDWLDGVVTWHGIVDTNAPPMRGAPPMRSGGDSCSCGCLVRDGLDLIHYLSCVCEHCYANGELVYEGRSEEFGCDMKDSSNGGGGNSPGGNGSNQPDPELPSVTLTFDKSYVIFEAGYEDAFGEWVSSTSTTAKLTITASGGEHGISINYDFNGIDVVPDSGGLPSAAAAHETVTREVYCKGVSASYDIGSSSASAIYTDDVTFDTEIATKPITSVEVKLQPVVQRNGRLNRHTVGVREIVGCQHYPLTAPVVWSVNSSSGAIISNDNQNAFFVAPLISANVNLLANCWDANYYPQVTIQEPTGLWCSNDVTIITNAIPTNRIGGIGVHLELYVLPSEVSFENIATEEVPCTRGTHSGYFTNSNFSAFWSHTYDRGAGRWRDVGGNNYFGPDDSTFGDWQRPVPWMTGTMTWAIPIGWNEKGTKTGEQYRYFHDEYQSKWEIMGDGSISKSKHGYTVIKDANGQVRKEGPNNGN